MDSYVPNLLLIQFGIVHLLVGAIAHAQSYSQAAVEDFVPPDYAIILRKDADFNNDGRLDVILVLSKKNDSYAPRPLLVLFREAAGGYSLSIRSDQAIPEAISGGVASTDGFNGIKIKRNGFVISQFSGSSVRYSYDWQFRFQGGDWYLIGETKLIGGPGVSCPPLKQKKVSPCGAYKIETNFITGNQIGTVYFDDGSHTVRRTTQKRDLVRLSDFPPDTGEETNFQW